MDNKPFPANTSNEIAGLRGQLRQQFQEACRQAGIQGTPEKLDPQWPEELQALHQRLQEVDKQTQSAFRRQDQAQLSAFMKDINSKDGPSAEAMRWWWNRY